MWPLIALFSNTPVTMAVPQPNSNNDTFSRHQPFDVDAENKVTFITKIHKQGLFVPKNTRKLIYCLSTSIPHASLNYAGL